MRILIYHPVHLPVFQYGGTERVVLWLLKTLLKKGHEVAVFAAPGSFMPDGIGCYTDPQELPKLAAKFDVLHGFTKPPQEVYEAFQGRVMVTIEGNGQLGERFHPNTVFVSRNHAERHGATEFVYNGLDPDELSFLHQSRPNRFLYLSKTSWKVKNLKGAMSYASRFGQNLWIAGGERPYSLRVVTAAKRMLGRDWRWVGLVNQEQKAKFLLEGKALVFPLLWNEPFGLVITESLVSGTPVLAHPFGSVPELLEFAPQCLMHSSEDWKAAMTGQVRFPSAQECRDWVLAKFHQDQMAESYLKLYEKVAAGKALHAKEPVTLIAANSISFQEKLK